MSRETSSALLDLAEADFQLSVVKDSPTAG